PRTASESVSAGDLLPHQSVKLSSGVFQMCFYRDWRKSQTLEFPGLVTDISATDIGTEGDWEGSKVTGRFSSTSPVCFTSVVDADADSKPWLSRSVQAGYWLMRLLYYFLQCSTSSGIT